MRFGLWRRREDAVDTDHAIRQAEAERLTSQRLLDAARPRIELLRKMRGEDHVSPLLDGLIQKRDDQ